MSQETTLEKPPVSAAIRALDRIAVRPPYFDLRDLEELRDGGVAAIVPVTPTVAPERGSMEAAQVARHLAILGSCAAALGRDDDTPHHYLATAAHYMRLAAGPEAITADTVRAEALARWIDKRSVRAYVKLMTHDRQGLHVLDVQYSVLTTRMFGRVHPPLTLPQAEEAGMLTGTDGPWEIPNQIETVADGYRLACGPVPVEACAGHFPGYPAAPVAVVMGHLCRLGGQLAVDRTGGEGRYQIEEGYVTASKLAAAGQDLVLEARYIEPNGNGHLIRGQALVNDQVVGTVEVTMSVGS